MDNKKIGKLIAELRKQKGLTQQELGDKVGVGFRSVSKWERGITLPDITIINEVSKILGISSDELLSGKVNKEHKENKNKPNSKITLSILVTIIISITSLIYYNTQTYTYKIDDDSYEYYVEGKVVFNKNNIMIIINKLELKNEELYPIKIINYEYQIKAANEIIVGFGDSIEYKNKEGKISIETILNEFRINYNGKINTTRKEFINNEFIIDIEFTTEDNQIINEKIPLKLTMIKKEQNNNI